MSIVLIELTQGHRAEIDEEDFELVSKYKWHVSKSKNDTMYAGSAQTPGRIMMHRLIMAPPPDKVVDHIDHYGLNNSRSNLQIVNNSTNSRLSRQPKNATNKYRGVGSTRYGYCVRIKHNYKTIYVGHYKNEEEAALAYNDAAIQIFGEGNFYPNVIG